MTNETQENKTQNAQEENQDTHKAILERQKKSYESNRLLALVLSVFLLFTTFKDIKKSPATWQFYLIMGILVLASLAVMVVDSIKILKLEEKLKNLNANNIPKEN